MKNRIYFLFSIFIFLLLSAVMALHFAIIWLPLFCFSAGFLARTVFPSAYLAVFSFLIPVLPALAVFENKGFPLNYLLLPIFFLCGIVVGELAVNKKQGAGPLPELPRFYPAFLSLLGISFIFVMLRWSNLTLSPLAFFRDTPLATTGQRISFGIIFPVVETSLFMLSPFYFILLQRLADKRRVLIAFLCGQSLSICFSLVQRFQESGSAHYSLRGLASDATAFGFLSALSMLLALYLYVKYAEKLLGVFFVAISMAGILNSTTRIGFFALVLGMLLFLYLNRGKNVPPLVLAVFLAVISIFFILFFYKPGSNLFARLKSNILEIDQFYNLKKTAQTLSGDLSAHRDVLGQYVLESLHKYPLTGVGTGNFVFWVMAAHAGNYFHHLPANQYFFFASSLGIPGLMVFVFFCCALFSLKKWPEKCLLAVLSFFFLFNDYLWFPEIALVFWLVASLGEKRQDRPFVWSRTARVIFLGCMLAAVFFNFQKFYDLHPKTWARENSASYDYGLYHIEHEKGQQFQWTGAKAGIYIYLDQNGRNNNFRLVCGAPLEFLKNREQVVDIYWRGRFFKKVILRNNEEYPVLIEDKQWREGFLEFRIRPCFSLSRLNLGRETRLLGAKLFGGDIPGIAVLAPKGGEILLPGSEQEVRWQSKGKIPAIKIEMSVDGGRTYALIGDSLANIGLYSWKINGGPSMNCVVRIGSESGSVRGVSEQPFSIAAPPARTGFSFARPGEWTAAACGSAGWYVGDFNGDGRSDLMRFVPGVSGAEVLLADGKQFVDSGSWTGAGNGADGWYVGDFNGDGRSDLMRYLPGTAENEVFLSNGIRFISSGNWLKSGSGADGWYVGDFNGDGRSDILRYVPGLARNEVFLSNGARFVSSGNWISIGNGADGWYVGDFNGDGRSDILRSVPGVSGAEVFISDGSKFVFTKSWTGAGPGEDGWYLGDFNGDKKCDIMRYAVPLSGPDVFLAGNTGFVHDGNWSGAGKGAANWYVGDFNGDGCADLLRSIEHGIGLSGEEVLLSLAGGGSSLNKKLLPEQAVTGNGRWLADMPLGAGNLASMEEKGFIEAIKNKISGGKEISIFEIQKEYEKLKKRKYRRVSVLRLLKHYKLNLGNF
jgi:hypothetical protein